MKTSNPKFEVINGKIYRRCVVCGKLLLQEEHFIKNGGGTYRAKCKDCEREYRRMLAHKKATLDNGLKPSMVIVEEASQAPNIAIPNEDKWKRAIDLFRELRELLDSLGFRFTMSISNEQTRHFMDI